MTAAGSNAWLKRLTLNLFPGMKYPWKPSPTSNVVPVILCEQLNPPQHYQISVEDVIGVHKVIGIQPYDASQSKGDRKLRRKTTTEEIATIRRLRRQGRTLEAIAARVGRHYSIVWRAVNPA